MDKLRLNIYVLSLCITFLSFGQKNKQRDSSTYIHQLNRIEFDMGFEANSYHIIPGGDTGLLVAVDTYSNSGNGNRWDMHSLDTGLNVVWTKVIFAPFDSNFLGYDFYNGSYYLLFNSSKYDNTELLLYEISTITARTTTYEINTVFPIFLSEFEVLDGTVLLAGNTNYRPVLLTYDFEVKKPKVIPGIYDKTGEILDIIMDDDLKMFTVIMSERMPNRRFTVIAKTFTSSGDLVQENIVDPGQKQNIVDGVATNFHGGFQYMAGTYSKKSTTYSSGLYLSKFVNGRQQLIQYHHYSTLNNFFGYMNQKRESRVKERIRKKAEKGKNANFSYKLLVHEIVQRGDEYLLIAEAYYPRYSSYYSPYSGTNSYSKYNTSFLGFNYTHAVVVAFDRNGNILWDNSFAIDNVLSYGLEEFVTVSTHGDKTVLMYLDENTIHSKIVSGNEIIEGKTFNDVKLFYQDDEVKTKNPDIEGLKPWYGNTLYAYGEQRIKNEKGAGGKIHRNIFYINKVEYHLDENLN